MLERVAQSQGAPPRERPALGRCSWPSAFVWAPHFPARKHISPSKRPCTRLPARAPPASSWGSRVNPAPFSSSVSLFFSCLCCFSSTSSSPTPAPSHLPFPSCTFIHLPAISSVSAGYWTLFGHVGSFSERNKDPRPQVSPSRWKLVTSFTVGPLGGPP